MTIETSNLNLVKINTATDGNLTVNLDTYLNENWDKIDAVLGSNGSLTTTDKTSLVNAINELVSSLADKATLSGSSSQTFNVAEPTQSEHAASKSYVDNNTSEFTVKSSSTSFSSGVEYQATANGLLIANAWGASNVHNYAKIDSGDVSGNLTQRAYEMNWSVTGSTGGAFVCYPIKKDEYFKATVLGGSSTLITFLVI